MLRRSSPLLKHVVANSGGKKKCSHPQCQSTATQPLTAGVLCDHNNPQELRAFSPQQLYLIFWINLPFSPWGRSWARGITKGWLGAGTESGRVELGYSACPYTCLHDSPSTSISTGICHSSATQHTRSQKHCCRISVSMETMFPIAIPSPPLAH